MRIAVTHTGDAELAAGAVALRKVDRGSVSSNFDEVMLCVGGGLAAIVVSSAIPFKFISIAASKDLLVKSDGADVKLVDGIGIVELPALITSTQIEFEGIGINDVIYVTRPATVTEYPYSGQSGMTMTRYTSAHVEYAGGKSIYPAGHIHQQASLQITISLPNLLVDDADSISESFDVAGGTCIIDDMYIFNLEWSMSAHPASRDLVAGVIKGKVVKPND